jgi:hypothetical protein
MPGWDTCKTTLTIGLKANRLMIWSNTFATSTPT